MRAILLLSILILQASCGNVRVARSEPVTRPAPPKLRPDPEVRVMDLAAPPPPPSGEPEVESPTEFTPVQNALVEKWIRYFTGRDRERFQRFLNRGLIYKAVVESVLAENDLPPELYFLAMIESGFRTDAHSHAKAAGVWQFIPGTAVRYGLRVDRYVDERRDPIRATEAAARYLRDLYNVFGSWHLAMAAYNAGEIRVLRAIFRGRSRDFWTLAEAGVLPSETMNYVPKFLAVVKIGSDPEAYGFRVEKAVPYPDLKAVPVHGAVRLRDLARAAGLNENDLTKVNPQIRLGHTPPGAYEVWVPSLAASAVARVAPRVNRTKVRMLASTLGKSDSGVHVVRRGENLGRIAAKYKISVGHLKRMNGLRTNVIRPGMALRTRPNSYTSKTVRYVVKRADNLSAIAKRFRTTVRNIKTRNKLRGNMIYAGQKLVIEVPGS